MPALPLDEAGKYVAAAYLVFLALVLIYVAIMAARLARIDRELGELAELADQNRADKDARGEAESNVFERSRSEVAETAAAGNVAAGEASGGVVP